MLTFANPQNYPVLVKTPDGFLSLRPGFAVSGDVFAPLAEKRVLVQVDASDYAGKLVYTSDAPLPPAREQVRVATTDGGGHGTAPVFSPGPSQAPEPVSPAATADGSVKMPDLDTMRGMNRDSLAKLARQVRLRDEGSRNTLLSRLTPLAGKVIFLGGGKA